MQTKTNTNLKRIKSNYSFKRTLSISIITSILLSNQLVLARSIDNNTLPNGGKFVGGSGSIGSCGKACMNIEGGKNNNVIAWGGGFNIGKDAIVNFKGSNKGYLNLDYSKNPSILAGKLNGGDNNIFIVNPSGVLVEKGGVINANRFVASTSAMSDADINKFRNSDSASFSPVFKANKGDIINKGNITTKNGLTLIGNKVDIQGGRVVNTSKEENKSIHLVGDKVYVDVEAILKNNDKIYITAKEGYIQRQIQNYVKDDYKFGEYTSKISTKDYGDYKNQATNFKNAITLGNMGNAKENAKDWWYFAYGWNYWESEMEAWHPVGKGDIRTKVDEFRLVGDIDFGGNEGKNYANFGIDLDGNGTIDSDEYTNMIIGYKGINTLQKGFDKVFDGQGYMLSNINIDINVDSLQNEQWGNLAGIGVFGVMKGGTIKNVNVDYKGGGIRLSFNKGSNVISIGSLVGQLESGSIENVVVKDFGGIETTKFILGIGGLIGLINESSLKNISLYYAPNAKMKHEKGSIGIMMTPAKDTTNTLENIHVYYKDGTLAGADDDSDNYGDANDKIQLHTYKNSSDEIENYPEFDDNNNGLSKVTLEASDYNKSILEDIYKEMVGGKVKVDVTKIFKEENGTFVINTDYLKTLGGESYQQAVAFLEAFYGEQGLGEEFEKWFSLGYKAKMEQMAISKTKFNEFLERELKHKIAFFEDWKAKVELYNSGVLDKEQMRSYEKWFADNEAILKDYQNFLDNPMLTDNGEHNFTLGNGSLAFINGSDYKNLSTPPKKDGGDDQTITTPLKDINSSMLDKQKIVLVKPAEEEKEALDEEKGTLNSRTCIVSENFKTNNPCMAQRI